MPVEHAFDYAIVRLVPRVDRGEQINVGVILSCPSEDFLEARIEVDRDRVRALDPTLDLDAVCAHLETIPSICRGDERAGALAKLAQRARFHWLVSPRSTIIQMSAVHTGRTADPAAALNRLMDTLVR